MHKTTTAEFVAELSKSHFLGDDSDDQSFAYYLSYYRVHSSRKRIWFRSCSVALIFLSSGLPVLAAYGERLPFASKDVLVGITSGLIAFLSGILSFFRWEVAWKAQNEAGFALRALHTQWEGALAVAHSMPDDAAIEMLGAAFERFRAGTYEILQAEMGQFFKVQKAPVGKQL